MANPSSSSARTSTKWNCQACTFENTNSCFKCAICGTAKGTASRKRSGRYLNSVLEEAIQQLPKAVPAPKKARVEKSQPKKEEEKIEEEEKEECQSQVTPLPSYTFTISSKAASTADVASFCINMSGGSSSPSPFPPARRITLMDYYRMIHKDPNGDDVRHPARLYTYTINRNIQKDDNIDKVAIMPTTSPPSTNKGDKSSM